MDKKAGKNAKNSTEALKGNAVPTKTDFGVLFNGEPTEQHILDKYKIIGENIRFERKARNFSVDNLAEYLGLSYSYILLLERGERCPSLRSFFRICDLFNCSPNDLLTERVTEEEVSKTKLDKSKKPSRQNKYDAIISLMSGFSDAELNFVIYFLKGFKRLEK